MFEIKEVSGRKVLLYDEEILDVDIFDPIYEESWRYTHDIENFRPAIVPKSEEVADIILTESPKKFKETTILEIERKVSFLEFTPIFKILLHLDNVENPYWILVIQLSPNLNDWVYLYSYKDFIKKFIEIIEKEDPNINFYQIELETNFFEFYQGEIKFHEFDKIFQGYISKYLWLIERSYKKTIDFLIDETKDELLKIKFNFPSSISVECEQYLLYFARFLKDLGINATSNLKEEAGKVLFSITPTDDIEALDKIREALAVYLHLPSSPIVYDDSFAAMRLKQQIDSLKHSQQTAETEFRLRMAQSLVEAQNKTIEDQSGMIVQQATFVQQQKEHIEKITNPAVMIKSAENKEELEELYEGVKVGESETLKKWLGISLNPAKAIKTAVKNTFGKDERKSVLGLDEDN